MSSFFSNKNYKRDYDGGRRLLALCMSSVRGSYAPRLNSIAKNNRMMFEARPAFLFGNTIGSSSLMDP